MSNHTIERIKVWAKYAAEDQRSVADTYRRGYIGLITEIDTKYRQIPGIPMPGDFNPIEVQVTRLAPEMHTAALSGLGFYVAELRRIDPELADLLSAHSGHHYHTQANPLRVFPGELRALVHETVDDWGVLDPTLAKAVRQYDFPLETSACRTAEPLERKHLLVPCPEYTTISWLSALALEEAGQLHI